MKNNILILISLFFFAVSCSTTSENVVILAFSKQLHAVMYNNNSEYKDIPDATVKKTGDRTVLNTGNVINFDFDSYQLKDEYNNGINEIYKYLNENQNVNLIIEGYTDSKGSDSYNIRLSENRARTILNKLVAKGIDRKRLRYIGYGSTRASQNNEKDRKCQFVIINSADEEETYKKRNETETIKLKR